MFSAFTWLKLKHKFRLVLTLLKVIRLQPLPRYHKAAYKLSIKIDQRKNCRYPKVFDYKCRFRRSRKRNEKNFLIEFGACIDLLFESSLSRRKAARQSTVGIKEKATEKDFFPWFLILSSVSIFQQTEVNKRNEKRR
jgi:hypothetical protein